MNPGISIQALKREINTYKVSTTNCLKRNERLLNSLTLLLNHKNRKWKGHLSRNLVDVYSLVKKNEDLYRLIKKLKENIRFQEKVITDKKIQTLEKKVEEMEFLVQQRNRSKKKKAKPPVRRKKSSLVRSIRKDFQKQITGISVNTFHKSSEVDITSCKNNTVSREDNFNSLIESNREQKIMNKRIKLMKAKTKITFLNASINKKSENRLSPSERRSRSRSNKKTLSPYSWRTKNKSSTAAELLLATSRMMNFRLKKRIKRSMGALLAFIEFVSRKDLESAVCENEMKLERVFDCERVCIFTKDLKGHLCLLDWKNRINPNSFVFSQGKDYNTKKYYAPESTHKIGECFKKRVEINLSKSREYDDYPIYGDIIIRKVINGYLVPIIDLNTKETLGVLGLFNKIKFQGFNEDEKSIATLTAKFLAGVISIYHKKDKVETIENKSITLIESCYRLFLSFDLGGLVITSQDIFRNMTKNENVLIHLLNHNSTKLVTYHKENRSGYYSKEKSIECGIVGQTIKKLRLFGPLLPERSEFYDPLFDLDTSFPLVSMPIKFGSSSKVIGVLQFAYPQALLDLNSDKTITELDYRKCNNDHKYIEIFLKYFACAVISLKL
ncbi:unnamed protein product [Moneuplotes crassus]|uniref:GAF domain-containing protein n=1 Tax=Euplotes crassus TaxID=5936 RepID=A0AAD1Y830_EUPCR|nr:unnamed protein product [Moneuplotes crassus]